MLPGFGSEMARPPGVAAGWIPFSTHPVIRSVTRLRGMPFAYTIPHSDGTSRRTVSPFDRHPLCARNSPRRAGKSRNKGRTCDREAKTPEPYNRQSLCRSAHSPSISGYGLGLHDAPRVLRNARSFERRAHGSLGRAVYSGSSRRSYDALPWRLTRASRHPPPAASATKHSS